MAQSTQSLSQPRGPTFDSNSTKPQNRNITTWNSTRGEVNPRGFVTTDPKGSVVSFCFLSLLLVHGSMVCFGSRSRAGRLGFKTTGSTHYMALICTSHPTSLSTGCGWKRSFVQIFLDNELSYDIPEYSASVSRNVSLPSARSWPPPTISDVFFP
jgi:hypothetical protein